MDGDTFFIVLHLNTVTEDFKSNSRDGTKMHGHILWT